jgi:dihydroflavonol-4-reductase
VETDLRVSAGWTEAVNNCKWVFHVASPQAVKTESDRVSGATKGTQYLMEAALASGTVKKVVVTSSIAAIAFGFPASKV